MARRKDHSREELTHLAVEAGRQLIIEDGPTALTARNVASAIGYTPGTLYNLFDGINGLIATINIQSMNQFAVVLAEQNKRFTDHRSRLEGLTTAYIEFHKTEPQLWSLLFAYPNEFKSDAYQTAIHDLFGHVITATSPISSCANEARQRAKLLWATLHGICLLSSSGKLNIEIEDPTEELVARFLDQFLKI